MVRLGDAATFINGYAFKPEDWVTEGLPIIRIQNLTGSSDVINYYNKPCDTRYMVDNGDILISWSASLGVYEWTQEKALLNQHIFKVVFNKLQYDKRFFMYIIDQKLSEMSAVTHGSTMKHITKKYFDAIIIPLPPLETQQKIADVLDRASALIEKRKAQIEKLDLLIKSQFIEMFGSVHQNNVYPYTPIKTFTKVVSGGTPERDTESYWENGTIRWVKTTELRNSKLSDTEEKITQKGLENSSAKIVPPETILIAMYGQGKTRGMTALLTVEATTNQACACILPCKDINQKFLWHYLMLSYDKLRNMAKGGNQPNLNGDMIKNFNVLMPPFSLQTQFADFVNQVEAQKSLLQQSLEKLELNYKSLMQKCFRGDLF